MAFVRFLHAARMQLCTIVEPSLDIQECKLEPVASHTVAVRFFGISFLIELIFSCIPLVVLRAQILVLACKIEYIFVFWEACRDFQFHTASAFMLGVILHANN